jgi:predicted dienelactone hydrolase
VISLLLLALVACPAPKDTGDTAADPIATLLAPGPWRVGLHREDLVYADPAGDGDRTLNLLAWYPTSDTGGSLASYRALNQPDAVWEDATIADGTFPVLVSSHGSQGYAEGSSFLFEHFASHGWIVLAPDHTTNTLFDNEPRTSAIYLQRPLDISAVIDHTESLPDGHPLAGHVGSPIVANGHSYGGYTLHALAGALHDMDTLEAACDGGSTAGFCLDLNATRRQLFRDGFYDDRIVAHISMAPGDFWAFEAPGFASIQAPVLLMTGELDASTGSDSDPVWAALPGTDHLRVDLLGGGHTTFTDYAGLLEDAELGLDPEEGWRIIRGFSLAFASFYAGNALWADVLDGTASISDAVRLVQKD